MSLLFKKIHKYMQASTLQPCLFSISPIYFPWLPGFLSFLQYILCLLMFYSLFNPLQAFTPFLIWSKKCLNHESPQKQSDTFPPIILLLELWTVRFCSFSLKSAPQLWRHFLSKFLFHLLYCLFSVSFTDFSSSSHFLSVGNLWFTVPGHYFL